MFLALHGILGLMLLGPSSSLFAQGTKTQLIVFEGSDWCAKCIRLNKEVLNDSSFVAFAQKEGFEVIHIDFPQRKRLSRETEQANGAMAERYGFQGTFPSLILTDGGSRRVTIPTDGDAVQTSAAIREILIGWR